MTHEQKARAEELRGKMSREDIAAELGISVSNLMRCFRGKDPFWFKNGFLIRQPELTKQVNDYFSAHGLPATVKRFPHLRVKSIVYRYHKTKPRQARWTPEQLVDLVKMAGLVSPEKQAKLFKRPHAHEGSIKSVWIKRFKVAPGEIHGMKRNSAQHLVVGNPPYLKTHGGQYLCLWVDMRKHLRPDVPAFMRDAIGTMADFQVWIFGQNVRREILKVRVRGNSGKKSIKQQGGNRE